jgi:hypothetical protein
MFADTSIILRPVGLGELSDAMVSLCFMGPLAYIPKISDIIIEFHREIKENYFKQHTYEDDTSRRMKEWCPGRGLDEKTVLVQRRNRLPLWKI